MPPSTFLLGLGAQKSGTTWLHRYLAEAPSFVLGGPKEYHVWDAIYRTDEDGAPAFEGIGAAHREALRAEMVAKPELYFKHFASLLACNGKHLAADITPAYAALPQEALERIRDGFADREISVKTIFLMRDPVERCWSAARMYKRKAMPVAGLDPAMDTGEFVLRYARTGHAQRRGHYERTIAKIEQVFAPQDTLLAIYEELFSAPGIARLSDFLGIEQRPDAACSTYNVSPRSGPLPDQVRAEIASLFQETLDFCRVRFPQTLNLWSSYEVSGQDGLRPRSQYPKNS